MDDAGLLQPVAGLVPNIGDLLVKPDQRYRFGQNKSFRYYNILYIYTWTPVLEDQLSKIWYFPVKTEVGQALGIYTW